MGIEASSEKEKEIKSKYNKIIGSAVNPVLREGNSDRRVAQTVKEYAKKNPHKVGAWSKNSNTHVSHMSHSDFYENEKSKVIEEKSEIKIIFSNENGKESILKEKIQIESKEIIDVSIMNMKELTKFFEKNIIEAKKENVLLSLHLKATMMKISDPIIFGCAVKTYFKDLFKKYEDTFKKLEINPNNGIDEIYNTNPNLAMVDSDKGITNLHLPNDIIIDASMPALIRNSGKMWGADGLEYDTKAMIPDRCYAG